MKWLTKLAGVAGLVLLVTLVARAGVPHVRAALATSAWGLIGAAAFHLVPMAASARAWQVLIGRGRRRSLGFFVRLVWLREAVNGLLPVARVGGEVATARVLTRRHVHPAAAVASLVVDVTVGLASQVAFTAGGLALLALRHPDGALARPAWLGLAAAVPLVGLLVLAQRGGAASRLARVARRLLGERLAVVHVASRRLDRALRALWTRRARLLRCGAWQLVGWCLTAGELWIFLGAAGVRFSIVDAVVVEALVQAVGSAAFVVPGALGVQEGAFLLLGGAVGLSPTWALALAISRRARDVLLFTPALAWAAVPGRTAPRGVDATTVRGPESWPHPNAKT